MPDKQFHPGYGALCDKIQSGNAIVWMVDSCVAKTKMQTGQLPGRETTGTTDGKGGRVICVLR